MSYIVYWTNILDWTERQKRLPLSKFCSRNAMNMKHGRLVLQPKDFQTFKAN